jgi:signal transduction histidine kinase
MRSGFDYHSHEFIRSLREDAFGTLLRCVGAGALIVICTALPAISPETGPPLAAIEGLLLLGVCWAAGLLRARHFFRLAVTVFLAGVLAAIALTVPSQGLANNPFIFFSPLMIGIAVLLLRPAAGLAAATAAAIVPAAVAAGSGHAEQLLSLPFAASVALGYLSAALTWLSSQSFFAAVDWALDSYQKVEKRESQLFESEQRLQRALAEKEYLNEQLLASNQALERARAAAEQASRMKTQFVRNMSHELRTPLNAIIGLSYILQQEYKGRLTDEQRDYVRRIYDSGDHLLRLLNDVLDLSKIEAGKLELRQEPLLLEPLVDEALGTTASLLHDRPLRLRRELPPDLPPVYADRLRVAQVLLNLLSNAAKFTEQGEIVVRAYVPHERPATDDRPSSNGHPSPPTPVVVEVADTGIGIAPEHIGLIFEEFRQVEEGMSRRFGGAGLGLPISRRLVELHGGTLTVESTPGVGSVFRFTLPVADGLPAEPRPEPEPAPLELAVGA